MRLNPYHQTAQLCTYLQQGGLVFPIAFSRLAWSVLVLMLRLPRVGQRLPRVAPRAFGTWPPLFGGSFTSGTQAVAASSRTFPTWNQPCRKESRFPWWRVVHGRQLVGENVLLATGRLLLPRPSVDRAGGRGRKPAIYTQARCRVGT